MHEESGRVPAGATRWDLAQVQPDPERPDLGVVPGAMGEGGPHEIAELLDLAPVGALVRTLDGDVITYWSHGAEEALRLDRAG